MCLSQHIKSIWVTGDHLKTDGLEGNLPSTQISPVAGVSGSCWCHILIVKAAHSWGQKNGQKKTKNNTLERQQLGISLFVKCKQCYCMHK